MKILKIFLVTLAFVLVIAYLGVSYYMAKTIVRPTGLTLKEERTWINEHHLAGDFDSYAKQDFKVKGYQGYTLHGQLIKAADSNSKKYVIITHGFRSNRNGSIKYVTTYHKLGYNVIIYDARGHGLNQKATVSLGNYEAKDLAALIKATYQRYGQDIYLGLHGESMGSATSLSVLAYKPKVKFVVADCGFTHLYDLIHAGYKENHLGFMIHGIALMTKLFYGVDMKKTSPIAALKGNQVPILFIHGQDDRFIKPSNSQKMAQVNPAYDEVHLVKGAAHAQSREILGEKAYRHLIQAFLEKINEK